MADPTDTADDLRALSAAAHAKDEDVHLLPLEVDALADLIDFAQHRPSCRAAFPGRVRPESAKCACGFAAALKALDADR